MWLVWLTAAAGEEAEHRKRITGSGHICGAAVDWGPWLPEQHPQGFSRQAQPKWCKDFFFCWQKSENMSCLIEVLCCFTVLKRHLNYELHFLSMLCVCVCVCVCVFLCVYSGEQGGGLVASGSEEAEGGESYWGGVSPGWGLHPAATQITLTSKCQVHFPVTGPLSGNTEHTHMHNPMDINTH